MSFKEHLTHWISSYQSLHLPVFSPLRAMGTWQGQLTSTCIYPGWGTLQRNTGNLSSTGNMYHIHEFLHREDNLNIVKYFLIYYWGIHGNKKNIQGKSNWKVPNKSLCKIDNRKYLTVNMINGAVRQRPMKSIFSPSFPRRFSNEASSSNSAILLSLLLTSLLVKTK